MVCRPRSALRPYQVRAAQQMQARRDDARGTANWAPMGLGKTCISLTAAVDLINRLEVQHVLVIGPKRVAQSVWTDEAQAWAHTRHLRMSVVIGTERQRLRALAKDADVYTINAENVVWLGLRNQFDMIVIDESDMFKNRSTKRFKAVKKLVKLARYVVLLTGTPATEGLHHLWAQFALLDDGKRLLPGYTAFLETYFKDVGYQFPKWVLKSPQAEQAIRNQISDITFVLSDDEALQLPAENRIVRYVELDARERADYDRFAREAVLPLLDGSTLTAASASAIGIKLAQLANGLAYDADRNVHVIHQRKLEEMRLLVSEAQGEPLLVSVEFRHDREMLRKEFGAAVLNDGPNVIRDWNAGKIPMLLLHPRSGGHGLNLQHGPGHTLVRYGMLHSLSLFLQVFARIRRSGQKSPYCNDMLVLCRGTVDEEIYKAVLAKRTGHNGLLTAMRNYARSL